MQAPLFNLPIAQPISITGDIMPGCWLRFYRSETTDLEDIFADGDLTTPLANPLTANAAGRFVAIFMDPRIAYRVQLFDADDVLQYDIDPYFPIAGLFPGMVVMFDGDLGDIPAGWSVCDSTGGTIDTRDRFPVGVSATKPLGQTGGSTGLTGTTGSAGAHAHGAITGDVTLTVEQIPAHAHTFLAANNASDSNADGWLSNNDMGIPGEDVGPFGQRLANEAGTQIISDTGGGDPHSHVIESDGAHTHELEGDIDPPYFAIYFLKFTG